MRADNNNEINKRETVIMLRPGREGVARFIVGFGLVAIQAMKGF
jgi:hypothetical protein